MLWAKRFRYNPVHLYYYPDNRVIKNILVTNDAIYFTALFNAYFGVVAKLDLDGNLKWSKYFSMASTTSGLSIIAPVYSNNILYIIGASGFNSNSTGTLVLTKLDENNGNIVESFGYITSPDTLVKGILPTEIKFNLDSSISLTGLIAVQNPGYIGVSSIIFNTLLDANLNPVHNYYFKNNIVLSNLDIYSDFNNQRQHAFLGENTSNRDKFFLTFGNNDKVLRTRKLSIPSAFGNPYRNSVNIDDKQNLHFIYHHTQGSQLVTEYARISDFAPSSTPGCFGKDTSILTQYPFTLIKSSFTWENVTSDVLISSPVVFTEDTAIVTKELVCKLVSYCDSVHISGPTTVCINQPVRYTVTKNAACLKSLQWNIDTALATIVSTEADTAITLSFKQAFTGYIHAAVYNCVVTDSFFVTVKAPQIIKLINRDSLLCPGKTIVLKAKPGFAAYLWQNGSTADSLRVTTIGYYKVTGTDNCGLQSADSITVINSDTSLVLPAMQTICKYDTAYITLPNDVYNITWQPANNGILNNKILSLFPQQTTMYQVTAERQANCPITKASNVVVENCTQVIYIPNAFTPNNDSRNDVFKPSAFRPLQAYHLAIYNRYGQKIFETTNISAGWDGRVKGKPQPVGGYTYRCSYQFTGGLPQSEAGYFILIR
ncbi:MAG: gliding motility-associated C-terminal domain-containing protein [Chitinophagaceae bacterium]|nr:gliding motility-associated C-terminal domain-containing protein [Chitinophagaceae bacterium]